MKGGAQESVIAERRKIWKSKLNQGAKAEVLAGASGQEDLEAEKLVLQIVNSEIYQVACEAHAVTTETLDLQRVLCIACIQAGFGLR